jgi:carboxyl-terminal processing protease
MRTLVPCRPTWRWLLAAVLPWGSLTAALAAPPSAPATPPAAATAPERPTAEAADDPDVVLRRALDFERQRNWTAAIEVYDEALDHWPSRTEFSHRRRLCESHYRLGRRYQDQSFRNVLLRLRREQALAVYDEVLERIETHYVDPVEIEPLVRRGLDNLEVALRDPNFLRANGAVEDPGRVNWLRDALRRTRAGVVAPDRGSAQAHAVAACDLARQALGLPDAAVVLEFAYGACDALDDYTSYLTPDKLDDLYAMIDGNFVGLGVELKQDSDGLRIVGVIRGGPAYDAGLKAGDQIIQISGRPVTGSSLDESANRLQGAEGSTVEITVRRTDSSVRSFRMVRRHVEVESVSTARIVDPAGGVGYIQLTGFQKSSTEELDRAISALRRQGMRSLVLDLRGNPGGLLNVAVEIAERFIDGGVIVSTRGRAPGQSQVYRAGARAVWRMPLLVLIDHESASASEILAGALKDHRRATDRPRERQRQRDPRRRAEGPPPGDDRRRTELRQGLGAEHLRPAVGPRGAEADDRQVLLPPEPALQRAGGRARPGGQGRREARERDDPPRPARRGRPPRPRPRTGRPPRQGAAQRLAVTGRRHEGERTHPR